VVPGVYGLAHAVWLPEAMRTLAQLEFAVDHKNARDVHLFCDQLRRGAHLVRSQVYITVSDDVEQNFRRGYYAHCQATIEVALACSRGVAHLLERMKSTPAPFEHRGLVVNSAA
ncbi:MAG TPA: hypothetical protein VNF68_14045, partial [Candidatus Baltobacteraceae bacterium]|nr:hypothetical protein [Candidatus Baltobacteraceae bacterium]